MTDRTDTDKSAADAEVIEPFVALLGAHVDLISETSEETALQLSDGLSALRGLLLKLKDGPSDSSLIDDALDRTSDLQSLLQTQDILRQQVVAVREGIGGLSGLKDDDVMRHIDNLKDGYVMPQQWDIHTRVTGEEKVDEPSSGGPLFF